MKLKENGVVPKKAKQAKMKLSDVVKDLEDIASHEEEEMEQGHPSLEESELTMRFVDQKGRKQDKTSCTIAQLYDLLDLEPDETAE